MHDEFNRTYKNIGLDDDDDDDLMGGESSESEAEEKVWTISSI